MERYLYKYSQIKSNSGSSIAAIYKYRWRRQFTFGRRCATDLLPGVWPNQQLGLFFSFLASIGFIYWFWKGKTEACCDLKPSLAAASTGTHLLGGSSPRHFSTFCFHSFLSFLSEKIFLILATAMVNSRKQLSDLPTRPIISGSYRQQFGTSKNEKSSENSFWCWRRR